MAVLAVAGLRWGVQSLEEAGGRVTSQEAGGRVTSHQAGGRVTSQEAGKGVESEGHCGGQGSGRAALGVC